MGNKNRIRKGFVKKNLIMASLVLMAFVAMIPIGLSLYLVNDNHRLDRQKEKMLTDVGAKAWHLNDLLQSYPKFREIASLNIQNYKPCLEARYVEKLNSFKIFSAGRGSLWGDFDRLIQELNLLQKDCRNFRIAYYGFGVKNLKVNLQVSENRSLQAISAKIYQ